MKRSRSFTIQKKLPKNMPKERDMQSLDRSKAKGESRRGQSVPEAIMAHISKRSDVEIIVFYEQYR